MERCNTMPSTSKELARVGQPLKVPSTDASSSKRSERSDEQSLRSAMRKTGGKYKQEKVRFPPVCVRPA